MVTILLEKILSLLEGWSGSFASFVISLMAKLDLIETETANLPDIKSNTDDIKDNTGAIVTPVSNINDNVSSIKTNSDTIKTTVGTMSNQLGTISTNVGTASAFAEDCANNTLDCANRLVTIGSDTTQIRTNSNTVITDLDKLYEAIKWLGVGIETTETESGSSPLYFNTDIVDSLEALNIEIEGEQTGSGTPSPSNEMPITTYSSMVLTANGNNISVSFGNDVYSGVIDVVSGKLTLLYDFYTLNGSEAWTVYSARNGFRINTNNIISTSVSDNLCNRFIFSSNYTDFAIRVGDNGDRYYFCNILDNMPTVTDLASWKTWLSNNNLQIASKLVTPVEITLSPETINTIKGNNTISININGNIEVTYKESVKNYLDKHQ